MTPLRVEAALAVLIFQVWNVGLDNVTIAGDVVPVDLLGFGVE